MHAPEPSLRPLSRRGLGLLGVAVVTTPMLLPATGLLGQEKFQWRPHAPTVLAARPLPSDQSPATRIVSADTPVESRDDQLRRLIVGTWQDEYHGRRTLTVRSDGTATMVIEFSGWKARLFTDRLQIETVWQVQQGRFQRQIVGGQPNDKLKTVIERTGDRADEQVLELTSQRLLVLDGDGKTRYDWRRVR